MGGSAKGFLESSSSGQYYSSPTVPYLLLAGYLFLLLKIDGWNTTRKNPPSGFWRSLGVLAAVMVPLRDLSLFFIFFSSFSSDSLTFSSIAFQSSVMFGQILKNPNVFLLFFVFPFPNLVGGLHLEGKETLFASDLGLSCGMDSDG
ncbi:hypothetical protein SLA2020_395240 [Shorea laevis]